MKKTIVGIAMAVLLAGLLFAAYTIDEQSAEAKHFREKIAGRALKLAFTNLAVDIPLIKGYYNGEEVFFIHTEASDKDTADMLTKMVNFRTVHAPLLAKAPRSALADVYVFQNGIPGNGPFGFQLDVFDSTPGQTNDYSPWRMVKLVNWNEEITPRELKSVQEIMDAQTNGELQVTETQTVVNMPMIKWPAGQMMIREDKNIRDDMPYMGPGQATKIDTNVMKVTFIAHRGWGPEGKTIYYIVTDATPEMPAKMMGVVYAPKTENLAISPAAVDLFQFGNGIKGSGPMGFQAGIGAANSGDENYSPMWRISFINWKDPAQARILETLADISKVKNEITVEPAMDGKHVVNCPFIELPK
jgi:hypothetical protein